MIAARFRGVLAPITTPFDPVSGDVSREPLQRNIGRFLADGLAGILVAGSSGEAPLLDREEQRRLVAWAREVMPEDRYLLVGTGSESTRMTIALSKEAGADGADAVLVRPPGYYAPMLGPATLLAHFHAVADASPIPVLIYNIPKYTHVGVPPGVLQQLASHPNIVGVKDSSGDPANLAAYRAAVPGWSVLVGSATLLARALELACEGGILGVACFAARRCVDLFDACLRGDARAPELQRQIAALDQAIVGKLGPAGIKAAMDALGLAGGDVRPPLAPLSAVDREQVARLVRA